MDLNVLGKNLDCGGRWERGTARDPHSVAFKVSEQIAPQKRSVKISTNFHFVIIYRKRGFLPWPCSHQACRKKNGRRKPLQLMEACLLI